MTIEMDSQKSLSTPVDMRMGVATELPFDICKLPSKGLVYDSEHPLHKKEVIEFKSMAAHEENILATPALLKQGTVLNVLIGSCLVNKSIDPLSLLIGDKAALLFSIRISGFGDEYTAKSGCPDCGKVSVFTFNLRKAEIKPLGAEPIKPGQNLFEYTLPISKAKLKFALPTDGVDLEIMKIQENRKKAYQNAVIDTTITDRLKLAIKEINGKADPVFMSDFIMKMKVKDSRSLRKYMSKIEPDLILKEEVNCRYCGERSERNAPIGYEFFWPHDDD